MRYKVKKALNNNVVLVRDSNNKESILIGNGIGFNAKENQSFCQEEKVKQTFVLNEQSESFSELIKNIDSELISLVEEEIMRIQHNLNKPLNENIHATLIDHIAFAIDRHKKGLDFRNPFNKDLSILLEQEYTLAKGLIERINAYYHIALIEDEIGVTAIHIHSAINDDSIEIARRKMTLIQITLDGIFNEFPYAFSNNSLGYQRLLVHIRYAYERILSGKRIENNMFEYVLEHYHDYFSRMKKVALRIEAEYEIKFPDAEISYLVLHLMRLVNEKD